MFLLRVGGVVLVVASLPLVATVGARYKGGPPVGRTGGFGEMTCEQCHFGNPVNDPGGELTLSGVPATFTAGTNYTLTVQLKRPGAVKGGFELSARFAEGDEAGQQAGSLAVLDDRAQIIPDKKKALAFAAHTELGAFLPNDNGGEIEWTIEWTAPEGTPKAVLFNVAANAANGDDLPDNDFIYLQQAEARPEGQ